MIISVLLIVYNDEKYISEAIKSILQQNYKNFELIIIDDYSTDSSYNIARSFNDNRIRLFRNKTNCGIAKNRNNSVSLAKGQYLFFTDSDCIVDKNWLKEGLRTLKNTACVGVEGYTYYIIPGYNPTLSDRLPGTVESPRQYMTCNMAYKSIYIKEVKGFNNYLGYNEDRELAIKIKKIGKINYNNRMIVKHQKKTWTIVEYIKSGRRASNRVLLFKYNNEKNAFYSRILYPENLLKILFPPLLIYTFFNNRICNWNDMKIFLAIYPKLIYERYNIWKTAIKEKILVI